MRILVTGSAGTLGTPLCSELIERGHIVYECDLQHQSGERYIRADVRSFRQLDAVIQRAQPELVYHLAAEFGRLNGEEYYDTLWSTNVIGTRNLLEIQARDRFRVIFASSSEIYGDTDREPLAESLSDEVPLFQTNDYAITKWVNERQCINYANRHGNEIVRLRFFNAYGPGERYHNYRSVVCLFCYRALHDLPYTVYRGYHRVFMYIDDFVPTLAHVCDRFRAGEVYNIGGTEYRSVEELSDMIHSMLGKDQSRVAFLPEEQHNIKSKRPDISKARREFGHDPKVTLETGVSRTLDWMSKQ